MKVIKKVLYVIAWALIAGGALAFLFILVYNRTTLTVMFADPAVQASARIFLKLLICALIVLVGLVILSVALRVGIGIRAKERDRKRMEAEEKARVSEADDASAEKSE